MLDKRAKERNIHPSIFHLLFEGLELIFKLALGLGLGLWF